MITKQDPRYFSYSSFPKRQCAVTGPVDGNGKANFLSGSLNTVILNASTDDPVVVTWANGFNPFPVDYAYVWTSVTAPAEWTGFSIGTHFLYIDYDPVTESVSYGKTTVAPVDGLIEPSHGSGVHWFNLSKYKMYESDGKSSWDERIRVFVGECASDGTSVTTITTYAYNGLFQGTLSLTNNNSYNVLHDVGTTFVKVYGYHTDITGAGGSVGVVNGGSGYPVQTMTRVTGGSYYGTYVYIKSSTLAEVWTGISAVFEGSQQFAACTGSTLKLYIERSY